jgi:prephenate dehydrogenase
MSNTPEQVETCVVVVGVGLIGGSVAAALKSVNSTCHVIGFGRNAARLEEARKLGLLDACATHPGELPLTDRTLVVVCLPVEHIAASVRELAAMSGPQTVITDAGSVKRMICSAIRDDASAVKRFVGAHPIAGGENAGFENSSPELFQDRCCIVTPEVAAAENVDRVSAFWRSIGCRVQFMGADQHDGVVALTSHLPHLMAVATTLVQSAETMPFTGTGFRDSTRIAAGDARLWTQILLGNRPRVLQALSNTRQQLDDLFMLIERADAPELQKLLQAAVSVQRHQKLN